MNFERVIETILFNQPYQTTNYYAGIYNTDRPATKALLYSTCLKEKNHNHFKYSEEELKKLDFFIEQLLSDNSGNSRIIIDCITLLHSKI